MENIIKKLCNEFIDLKWKMYHVRFFKICMKQYFIFYFQASRKIDDSLYTNMRRLAYVYLISILLFENLRTGKLQDNSSANTVKFRYEIEKN